MYLSKDLSSNLNLKKLSISSTDNIVDFAFHPRNENRALILLKTNSEEFSRLYFTSSLWESSELSRFMDRVVSAFWGNVNGLFYDEGIVFGIRALVDKSSSSSTSVKSFFTVNVDTDKKIKDKVQQVLVSSVMSEFILVVVSANNGDTQLYVSNDNGFNVRKATFYPDKRSKFFNIVDVSNGAITVNVFHGDNEQTGISWGTTYISDFTGSRFKKTIPYNRRYGDHVDYYKVPLVEGIYIANIITNHDSEECRDCADNTACLSNCNYQTQISFNRGEDWNSLYLENCQDKSSPLCQVQLNLYSSIDTPPIYSDPVAPGIIYAVGNIGDKLLSTKYDTFISLDGGYYWKKIFEDKPKYITSTDRGGFTVTMDVDTKQLNYFSIYNETIKSVQISENELRLKLISRNNKNSNSRSIFIFGEIEDKTQIHALDFKDVHNKICDENSNSDYEYFFPATYMDGCFLGRRISYQRKRLTSLCHPNMNFVLSENRINCQCTYSDYQCDDGFENHPIVVPGDLDAFECKPFGKGQSGKSVPNPCIVLYNETKGYVRVPGDSCKGGISIKLDPELRSCPEKFSLFTTLAIIALVAFLITFGCVLVCRGNPILQSWFEAIVLFKSKESMSMESGYSKLVYMPSNNFKDNEDHSNDEISDSDNPSQNDKKNELI